VADRCGFCGSAEGPFTRVEGLFTVPMCMGCLARRARGRGPYPDVTEAELRGGLDLLPTWELQQKAAAFSVPACERRIPSGWLRGCLMVLYQVDARA
jgi:hypothetical protein